MAGTEACFVACILTLLCIVAAEDVIVETSSGKVAGIKINSIIPNEHYYSFMGIPYAEPPIDDLRFMPPKPHPGWEGVLDGKTEKKPCSQFNLPIRPIKEYGFYGSDDCLHLSIHTPKLPSNQDLSLPVIVFFHNEHFRLSNNASREYGPDFFMKENVVLVTVNHRLGTFGFLSYEDDLLPGNNGIKDVILALKWIQTNIHKFNGNTFRITLMGNDGGAVLIDILLNSPKAKGLFSGAILQSGTSWSSTYFNEKEKGRLRAKALAEELELQHTSSSLLLKDFSRVSSFKIAEAQLPSLHADESRSIQMTILPFSPVIEHDHPDAIITQLPEDRPIDIGIPIMIGYNTREGIEISERFLRKPQYLTFADRDFSFVLPIRVDFRFEINTEAMRHAMQEMKDFYFDEGYVKISRPGELITYIGDVTSFYPIDYTVRKYINESITPVYYYAFDYSGEFNLRKKKVLEKATTIEGTWGAALGDELCYLFVCKAIKKEYIKAIQDEDSEDMKVIRNMVRLWTNFAKTGNPTPPGDAFIWPPASKENKECLVINEELQIKTKLHEDTVNFWDNFLAKYKDIAVNGVIKDTKDEL